MASFFSSHSFSSPVGQRIERATDEKLASEDWGLNIEICDIINETDEGPKDAIRAIKKRLSTPKDFKVVMLTLTVLETCVKNCNKRFHLLVCHKDFLPELTKLLSPKCNAPTIVQDRILSLIQTWSDAFGGKPDLDAVAHVYQGLKAQGVQFPAQDLDSFSPIYTPERTVPVKANPTPQPVPQGAPPAMVTSQYHHYPPAAPTHQTGKKTLTPEKLAKLRSQLDVVQGNIQVMSEMLVAVTPELENPEDYELLKELNRTCRSMQTRLVQLLDQVGCEEVTEELLRVNDDLNNVFIRYDRYERNRSTADNVDIPPIILGTQQNVDQSSEINRETSSGAALIDFGNDGNTTTSTVELDEPIATQFETMAINNSDSNEAEDEFDMFAQTRQSTFEDSRKLGSTYEDNSSTLPDQSIASAVYDTPTTQNPETGATSVEPSGIEGVEDWLSVSDLPSQTAEKEQSSMTSSEFDKFLQDRALSGGSKTSGKSKTSQRQMQKDVEETEEMFGL